MPPEPNGLQRAIRQAASAGPLSAPCVAIAVSA